MSDLPERIWYIAYGDFRATPSDRADDVEYIRKDIADAAVKVERERCAKVALRDGAAMGRAARLFMPPHTHAEDAIIYHMQVGGAQTAQRIAAAIRNGGQP
jgi:hypothetical protein